MQQKAFIDNDGVLFEYRRGMIKRIAIALGKPLTESFLEHFYETTKTKDDSELINAFSVECPSLQHLLNADDQMSFAAEVKLYENTREGLILLRERNVKTYIVTARTEKMRAATIDSLRRYNLLQHIDDVFLRPSQEMLPENFKAAMAVRIGATFAFEDTFHNLAVVVKHCTTLERAYLINRPWNAKHIADELYPTRRVPIERMDSFFGAVVDAVATLKE